MGDKSHYNLIFLELLMSFRRNFQTSPQLLAKRIAENLYEKTEINKTYNPRATWVSQSGFKRYYSFIIFIAIFVAGQIDRKSKFRIVHLVPSIITLFFFHWGKGNKDMTSDGSFDNMTFWEQIDQTSMDIFKEIFTFNSNYN